MSDTPDPVPSTWRDIVQQLDNLPRPERLPEQPPDTLATFAADLAERRRLDALEWMSPGSPKWWAESVVRWWRRARALAVEGGLEMPPAPPESIASGVTYTTYMDSLIAWVNRAIAPTPAPALIETPASPVTEPEEPGPQLVPAEPESVDGDYIMRVVALAGGGTGGRMFAIAQDKTLSTVQKQRAIYALDNRVVGWTGEEWGDLCGVSAAAARDTDWWKVDRKRLRGRD